jgi:hypothetical protein
VAQLLRRSRGLRFELGGIGFDLGAIQGDLGRFEGVCGDAGGEVMRDWLLVPHPFQDATQQLCRFPQPGSAGLSWLEQL